MDKIMHFGISLAISALITFALSSGEAVGVTGTIGVGKETLDYMSYGRNIEQSEFIKMAGGDLIADGLGIMSGVKIGQYLRGEKDV